MYIDNSCGRSNLYFIECSTLIPLCSYFNLNDGEGDTVTLYGVCPNAKNKQILPAEKLPSEAALERELQRQHYFLQAVATKRMIHPIFNTTSSS